MTSREAYDVGLFSISKCDKGYDFFKKGNYCFSLLSGLCEELAVSQTVQYIKDIYCTERYLKCSFKELGIHEDEIAFGIVCAGTLGISMRHLGSAYILDSSKTEEIQEFARELERKAIEFMYKRNV